MLTLIKQCHVYVKVNVFSWGSRGVHLLLDPTENSPREVHKSKRTGTLKGDAALWMDIANLCKAVTVK